MYLIAPIDDAASTKPLRKHVPKPGESRWMEWFRVQRRRRRGFR